MTSNNTLSQYTSNVHKIADQYEIACTLHPPPIRGWFSTNSLRQAKRERINLSKMVRHKGYGSR